MFQLPDCTCGKPRCHIGCLLASRKGIDRASCGSSFDCMSLREGRFRRSPFTVNRAAMRDGLIFSAQGGRAGSHRKRDGGGSRHNSPPDARGSRRTRPHLAPLDGTKRRPYGWLAVGDRCHRLPAINGSGENRSGDSQWSWRSPRHYQEVPSLEIGGSPNAFGGEWEVAMLLALPRSAVA